MSNLITEKSILTHGLLLSFLVCGASIAPLQAATYKWTDADGNVHYSERPPPGEVKAETINVRSSTSSATTSEAGDATEATQAIEADEVYVPPEPLEETPPQLSEEQQRQQAELRRENCAKLRAKLTNLQSSGRIKAVDAEGNVTRTTEEERQRRINTTREKMQIWCD